MVLSIKQVQDVTALSFKIPLEQMRAPTRSRRFARPRQVAMYLARELTGRSLPEIGRQFGGRDHTTVLHAHRTIALLIQEVPEFGYEVAQIRTSLLALQPSQSAFNLLSLGEWLALARRVNVPAVPARFLTDLQIEDVFFDSLKEGPRAYRIGQFEKSLAARPVDHVFRWDFGAPERLRLLAGEAATPLPPVHRITLDDPALTEGIKSLPSAQKNIAVWSRPWAPVREERGLPVQYRAFVKNGQLQGISNRHPQRPLRESDRVLHDLKLVEIYTETMIAAQLRPLANLQVAAGDLDLNLMHGTLDFLSTLKGLMFLDGGLPELPLGGADTCCFRGALVAGVALSPRLLPA